jgi:hypothetical protein
LYVFPVSGVPSEQILILLEAPIKVNVVELVLVCPKQLSETIPKHTGDTLQVQGV